MVRIAKISMAHVHAGGYARRIHENPETELVAVWDEEEYGGKDAAEQYEVPFYTDLDEVLSRDSVEDELHTPPHWIAGSAVQARGSRIRYAQVVVHSSI